MDTPQSKGELLARIREEAARWEALLTEVGEARMLQPGAMGDLAFKDFVAHMSGWRSQTIARLDAGRRGEAPTAPPWPAELDPEQDFDPINDWIYRNNRYRPLADVLQESRRQFQQMLEIVQATEEADLLDPQRFAWMGGEPLAATVRDTFNHYYEEHAPGIRAWLHGLNR